MDDLPELDLTGFDDIELTGFDDIDLTPLLVNEELLTFDDIPNLTLEVDDIKPFEIDDLPPMTFDDIDGLFADFKDWTPDDL